MKLVTITQFAVLTGLTRAGIYYLIKEKKIKPTKRKDPTGKLNQYIDTDKYTVAKFKKD